jgi:hypothetical protein
LKALLMLLALVAACREPTKSERILRMLHSSDPDEALRAVSLAGTMHTNEQLEADAPWTDEEATVLVELRRIFKRALGRGDRRLAEAIAGFFLLYPVGGPLPEFVECARSAGSTDMAQLCIHALKSGGDPRSGIALAEMLERRPIRTELTDYESGIRRHRPSPDDIAITISNALPSFGDAALPTLARMVSGTDPARREVALVALWGFEGSDAVIAAAAPALSDRSSFIRYDAVLVIEKAPAHYDLLRPLLDDPSDGVRYKARELLGVPR